MLRDAALQATALERAMCRVQTVIAVILALALYQAPHSPTPQQRPMEMHENVQGKWVITDDGDLRIHHGGETFVDLSRRPEELRKFRTISRWTALNRVADTLNVWKIKADEGRVLEIDGSTKASLYLAPGFEGKIHLAKGESALIFGKVYNADQGLTLAVAWDVVRVIPDPPEPHKTPLWLVVVCGLVAILAIGLTFMLFRRKKRVVSLSLRD